MGSIGSSRAELLADPTGSTDPTAQTGSSEPNGKISDNGDVCFIEAALSTYHPGPASGDVHEAWERLKMLIHETEPEIGPPSPLAALKFRMEQGGHTQADLAKLISHRAHASEILAGKRSLSKAQIATLSDVWGIPARSLLGPALSSEAHPISSTEGRAAAPATDAPISLPSPNDQGEA